MSITNGPAVPGPSTRQRRWKTTGTTRCFSRISNTCSGVMIVHGNANMRSLLSESSSWLPYMAPRETTHAPPTASASTAAAASPVKMLPRPNFQ
jgi:hypothetical protein